MWKRLIMCSLVLNSCQEWDKNPDGPIEEWLESIIETFIRKGAVLAGIDVDIKIDFTPESTEAPSHINNAKED